MNVKGKDGVPFRAHLEKAAFGLFPDLGAQAKLAEEPPLPAHTADMWAFFLEQHLRRPQGEFGPVRLSWTDIQAYSTVRSVALKPWQLRTLFAIEDAYFAVQAEKK